MWFFAGLVAFIAAIANLMYITRNEYKYCNILVFISLTAGLLALLGEYSLINGWIVKEDFSAMLDIFPSMYGIVRAAVSVGIVLNGIAVYFDFKRKNK